jgi:hypothetical protein
LLRSLTNIQQVTKGSSSVLPSFANSQAKISTLFSTLHSPRFGIKKLPSHLTLMRVVVLFPHGHGCGPYPPTLTLVTYFSQISRALLVRNHSQALPFVNRLFELFGDTEVGWDAARAIGQAGTVDEVLTKRNHAIIKVAFL